MRGLFGDDTGSCADVLSSAAEGTSDVEAVVEGADELSEPELQAVEARKRESARDSVMNFFIVVVPFNKIAGIVSATNK